MFDVPPEAFGSYRVLDAIRPGRFGPVYHGRDEATGLSVAIKIIDQQLTAEQATALAEAIEKLGEAPLQHPSIVPVLAAGADGHRVWVVEPWFDGLGLDRLLREHGAQPVGDVLLRMTQVAAAVDFAAAAGLHHGALHPREILATEDRTVVSGVGVLQAFTEAGLAVPMEGAYVSPHRQRGLPPASADDVFSLAWITYELVCGTPLPARSGIHVEIPVIAGLDRARFADVIERALDSDLDVRPASALEFAESLQEAITPAAMPAAAEPDIPPTPAVRRATSVESPPPVAIHDIPIRPAKPEGEDLPLRAARTSDHTPEPRTRHEQRVGISDYWFPVMATLAIGILMGFAGGYVVGQREQVPPPRSAERPVAQNDRQAPAEPRAADSTPAPTGGRAYTDSEVPPEGSAGSQAPTAPRAESDPREEAERERTARPDPTAPGVVQVDSRPRGARVFIDGRLVGTTPVVVSDVPPGSHAVRIDLSGHRRWVTTIEVAPGERERVAASLER